ncbi:unnamed protein product [Rotaria magnacalcarata]|uniref:Membrane-bound transcription factor site-2 protease n=4 Tax=Rotaria magnacalcarata TaxID=392030 RepID=A0A816PJ07_9BILA|nr:unnamed protein product [Rotaria magnacalcarata]
MIYESQLTDGQRYKRHQNQLRPRYLSQKKSIEIDSLPDDLLNKKAKPSTINNSHSSPQYPQRNRKPPARYSPSDHPRLQLSPTSNMFIRLVLQLVIFWFTVYVINYALLRFPNTKRSYIRILRSLGCHISICNIGFYSTSFNRLFYQIGRKKPHLWKIWFTIGIFVAFITAVFSCSILVFLPLKYIYDRQQPVLFTRQNLTDKNVPIEKDRDKLWIQPIIPGVNVPLEELGHFFLALLVCTLFHELGHAIAASVEQVRVNGCGYFLFILYPGAYVDLNEEQIQMITAYRQLRIYCAGVFHNMVLVVVAVVFLLIQPFILRHFYIETASVARISKDSPIYSLLPKHSTIQDIDGCIVSTSNDWYRCLRLISDRHVLDSTGYCLTQAEIQLLSSYTEFNQTSNYDCCQNLSQKNYCFLYHSKQNDSQNGACMEARSVTNHPRCLLQSDCQRQGSDVACVYPFSSDNITRLIRIVHSQGPAILFVGSIDEIYRTISIQSYKAKYSFISTIFITDIPLFFQYVAAFSFALAFFNAVPCYALDGQYILLAFIEHLSPSLYRRRHKNLVYSLIFCTTLLIVNISLAFARYFL